MGKQAKQPPPLLLTSHGECEEQYFYNLLENRYHTTRIPVLRNKSVLCSAFGWLVLLDQIQGECCLWNPTSSEIIHLPVVEHPSHYNRCFLSKPPTDPDCHILFSHVWTTIQIFCRIEDAAFTKSNLFEQGYVLVAMVSFKGTLYGIVKPAGIQKFEFATIHMAGDKIQAKPLLIDGEVPWEVPQALRSWISSNHVYLIELPCGDELLMVNKLASDMGGGVHFRIFRVDVDKMECEELDNLDGRTVFINYEGNGFCRSCESFGAAMKPNSICYTDIYGMVMYVHDLEDRSTITMLPYPDAHINPIMAKNFWVDIPMNLISCKSVLGW